MNSSNELKAIDELLRLEETRIRANYDLYRRYKLENSIEEEFKSDKSFEKKLFKNTLYEIPDSYLEKAVPDPQSASRAHLFYESHNQGDELAFANNCLDTLRHKSTIESAIYDHTNRRPENILSDSNSLENIKHYSSENNASLPKHTQRNTLDSAVSTTEKCRENPVITDEKMRNVMDNTALVKSLLDSFKNPSISNSQLIEPPPDAPVGRSRYETAKKSTEQLHQNTNQRNDNDNVNNDDLLNKMENFSNVMQDLLSTMKPYLEQQKNGTGFSKSSYMPGSIPISPLTKEQQYIPQESSSLQYQQHNQKDKKQHSKSPMNQQPKNSRYQNTNELHNESYNTNKKVNNGIRRAQFEAANAQTRGHKRASEANERGKPKALKRMQKIAKEHNL